MVEAVPYYRLHILDEGGGVVGAVDFECSDDNAANGHAEAVLRDEHRGELWRRIYSAADGNGHAREAN